MPKNNKQNSLKKGKKAGRFMLPERTKNWIGGVVLFLLAAIIVLSFFDLSGIAGRTLRNDLLFLIGKTIFAIPLILLIGGFIFFSTGYKKFFYSVLLAILILIFGMSGLLEGLKPGNNLGGWLGYIITWPLLKLFDFWVTQLIFSAIIIIGAIILWHLLSKETGPKFKEVADKEVLQESETKPSIIKKIFAPHFKVKEISTETSEAWKVGTTQRASEDVEKNTLLEPKLKPPEKQLVSTYQKPPLDLLERTRGDSSPGDTRINAAIIKKTLQNFDISVEMSEINIGPTVTQYALKPAEGVKLSKITGLSNDLALALAAHPIRIEAPIPGKSLVGIEVPNKIRAQVRLRELIENISFQKALSPLTIVLGKDVSGNPIYADLSRMPHLLVAGSTGTGKTIFLNNFILSLLYRNSPQILRFILIDPKRVEFPVYNELPHLLGSVIYDTTKTVIALKWLISEMERRFDILSDSRSRDVASHNSKAMEKDDILPYIVLIVDELADLMAAKGRDIEAGIVRLAQMSRAVGIHLVVATQRPSVEVITGLIKANITSRITFQVASQVDSRTVLDMAGAEKLLGLGDLLYLSAELGKPKRVQSSYVSEKEVKKVVNFIKSKNQTAQMPSETMEERLESESETDIVENGLARDLERTLATPESGAGAVFNNKDDFLYEEAKKLVLEAKKASASLLQRRLRIGYARAARLIDMLEESGIVGPGEGAKPREVFLDTGAVEKAEDNDWQKV